ncbi:MAG TPA: DUF167 domain-containing protein [Polyangia bacterium]
MSELRLSERDGGVTLDIVVQPRCPREGVGPALGDRLKVSVNAPPVEGKANQAVQRVLAEAFGVSRSAVTIVRGDTGKRKTVHIAGLTLAAATRLCATL